MGKIISNRVEYMGGGSSADISALQSRVQTIEDDYVKEADIPTELPASDVHAWAKAETKPSYTAQEIGADVSGTASNLIAEHDTSTTAHTDIRKAINSEVARATKAEAQALTDAKAYTDAQIEAIPTPDVSGQISTHNTNTSAHNDIRVLISDLTERLNGIADSDDKTLDQLSEIVAYIKANRELIESVTTTKVNISDIIDNLTTAVSSRPLSANQGVEIKKLIDALTTVVDSKASTEYVNTTVADATKWSNISDKPDNLVYSNTDESFINIETPVTLTRNDIADNLTTSDATNVLSAAQGKVLNSKCNDIQAILGGITEYSEDSTYEVGDYCLYTDNLYKCTTAITIPIAWDGSNHWTHTTFKDEINSLTSSLANMLSRFENNFFTYMMTSTVDYRYNTYSLGYGVFLTSTYHGILTFNIGWIIIQIAANSSHIIGRWKYGQNDFTEWGTIL